MKSIQLASNEYLLVFTYPDPEEVIAAINAFASEYNIASGRLQAVGSVQSATLAWWNNETNQVEKYPADGQFEVVSFLGNLATPAADNCVRVHAHAVLAGQGGTLIGGHVVTMTVRASLEVSLTAFDVPVTRAFNNAFNLCTIELP
ncbi:MAG TPA: PPC domain-containing DNA-binding protein [Thermoanaerobaculia bacterium]|nr:PPC domain-containing DNA-binding protein [Thermoanaerobaculia bacterium]